MRGLSMSQKVFLVRVHVFRYRFILNPLNFKYYKTKIF